MNFTAEQIAVLVGGKVEGDAKVEVKRPAKIEEAGVGDITFLANLKYEPYIYSNQPSVLLVDLDFKPHSVFHGTIIRVENVYASIGVLLKKYEELNRRSNVNISKDAYIESTVKIGENAKIYPQVYIGENVVIGKNVIIYPGVKIYHDCKIGDHVIIHANTVIGSDGFGFSNNNGVFEKIPQIGNVVIEDNVEIGSGCTIDRASLGSTIIRKGVKLDNQIQIAHSVEIGENTVIAAQTGIAGSTKIGKNCMIGGQVGIVGHIQIADNTMIQAQSGVASSVKEKGKKLYGTPAINYQNYLKSYIHFKNLPTLAKQVDKNTKSQYTNE